MKIDHVVDHADPMFRIVAKRDPIYASGQRGITTALGTKLFVFDKEIPNIVRVSHSVEYGMDEAVHTTITITIYGTQVVTEFAAEEIDVPQDQD